MKQYPQYCRYLDIPFQHVSDDILQSMRRGGSSAYIYDLIARIRETIPGIALRTTLISGYPTEAPEKRSPGTAFCPGWETQFTGGKASEPPAGKNRQKLNVILLPLRNGFVRKIILYFMRCKRGTLQEDSLHVQQLL